MPATEPSRHEGQSLRCSLRVEGAGEALRLDTYLGRVQGVLPSKKAAYKSAKRGDVLLNGAPAPPDARVAAGDRVEVFEPADIALPAARFVPGLLYLDPWCAVVLKPAGVPVMGLFEQSLELACATCLPPSAAPSPLPRAKPVHRLDVPTSGLVLIARTEEALRELSRQFRECEVRKTYRAIVNGRLDQNGTIELPLDGKPCRTDYGADPAVRSLHTEWVTPLTLHPRTGRTHQIRRHLAAIGHPVVGDREHGTPGEVFRGKGLFLAAVGLSFRHPEHTWSLGVRIPQPHKFTAYVRRERRRSLRPAPAE